MKVILLKDVKGKGHKDDIIDVSDGYGNNYLIKNKLAVLYTKGSKKLLDREVELQKSLEDAKVLELSKIKDSLENKVLTFKVNTGANDKVFGNISTKQISDKLKELGFKIDKKNIKAKENIDTLGIHKVEIILHKKVSFYINIEVIK